MVELRSRYGDKKVIFKSEKETTKEAILEAVSCGANLSDADLSGANLIDAGQDARGYRFVGAFRDGVRVLAGCRDFSVAEAKDHWAANPEALAKVALIEAVAALRKREEVKEPAAVAAV